MHVRSRALLAFLISLPASGCTLWYLATDPYDGLGEGADGSGGNNDGSSDALIDAYSPECGSLDTIENCGACGRICDHDASCVLTSGADLYNCSATQVEDHITEAYAIAAHDEVLYVVDFGGNVWTCSGACDTQVELFDAGGIALNKASIAVSDEGVFWMSDKLHAIELDGGALITMPVDPNSPVTVSAGGERVAWTDNNGIRWINVTGPGTTFGAPGSPFAGADTENVALVQNGQDLAWSTGEDVAHYTKLLGDGGSADAAFDTVDGSTNLTIASDNDNVFFTWRNKSGGQLVWLQSGTNTFEPLEGVSGAMKPAAVFGGNNRVYWSETDDTITHCDPLMCGGSHDVILTLGISSTKAVTAIAATPTYIFFLNSEALYRVSP